MAPHIEVLERQIVIMKGAAIWTETFIHTRRSCNTDRHIVNIRLSSLSVTGYFRQSLTSIVHTCNYQTRLPGNKIKIEFKEF